MLGEKYCAFKRNTKRIACFSISFRALEPRASLPDAIEDYTRLVIYQGFLEITDVLFQRLRRQLDACGFPIGAFLFVIDYSVRDACYEARERISCFTAPAATHVTISILTTGNRKIRTRLLISSSVSSWWLLVLMLPFIGCK